MKKLLLSCLLLSSGFLFSQGVRYDNFTNSTGTASDITVMIPVPGAEINVCTFPANGVPCTNKATTYTDQTLAMSCGSSTQLVLAGTDDCVAAADDQGNWGAWVAPGRYEFTITVGSNSYGPYPFTGGTQLDSTNTWTAPNSFTGSGVFTNLQMNTRLKSILNSCDAQASFNHVQGPVYATSTFSGCIEVPNTSTVHNANAVEGFANGSSTTGIPVGGYFQGWAKANGVNVEGANAVAIDTNGLTTGVKLVALEADIQPQNADSAYSVVNGVLVDLFTPQSGTHAGSIGVNVTSGQTGIFDIGFATSDGKVARSFVSGGLCSSGTCNSQPIELHGLNASVAFTSKIEGTNAGDLKVTPTLQRAFYVSNSHYGTGGANSDASGTISISSATSAAHSFTTTWNNAPICTITPKDDPTSIGTWWVTTTTSAVTAHVTMSGSLDFAYICVGNPN